MTLFQQCNKVSTLSYSFKTVIHLDSSFNLDSINAFKNMALYLRPTDFNACHSPDMVPFLAFLPNAHYI